MLTKSELKKFWEKHDFRPRKRLGQNFLIDKNIKDKILQNLQITPVDTVVEIGPGFGELTVDLARLSGKVFAIEKDKKIVEILKNDGKLSKDVSLIEKDFLDADLAKILKSKKAIIYGNLPYYITSPILEKLFNNITLVKDIYLVMQKEVADRIAAKPGGKDIGRLSLFVQYYAEPKVVFKIKRNSFYPIPKVDSVFLRLKVLPRGKVEVKDEKLLFEIIKIAYSKRRKTILNSLSSGDIEKDKLSNLLKTAKISPTARPETLSLADFARLADTIHSHKP